MVMLDHVQIKALRLKMSMSPTEFAAHVGASASAVCLWESGKRHPRWAMLRKLNDLAEKWGVIQRSQVPA